MERMENLVKFDSPVRWYYVASEKNAAHRATPLQSVPDDLGLSSEWLNGPAYLRTPIKEWPVNRDFT